MNRWRRLLGWFASRRQLQRERDQAVRVANQMQRLKDEEIAYLREQLQSYRDTIQTYQTEKQLQAAIAMADLNRLTKPRAGE